MRLVQTKVLLSVTSRILQFLRNHPLALVHRHLSIPHPRTFLTAKRKTRHSVVSMVLLSNAISLSSMQYNQFIVLLYSGALMLLAWFGCVFSAVYSARHLREHWPDTTIQGLHIWFHVSVLANKHLFDEVLWNFLDPPIIEFLRRHSHYCIHHSCLSFHWI